MAMSRTCIQRVGVDDSGKPCYRWRESGDNGACAEGTLNQLQAALAGAEVTLVLAGQDVVVTRLELSRAEQRHFHELAPYELEERLLVTPDSVHVARGAADGEGCLVAYTDREALAAQLDELDAQGIEVLACVALPLLLPRSDEAWTLALDDAFVHVHHASGRFVSVAADLAPRALRQLLDTGPVPARLDLHAADASGLQRLESLLLPFADELQACQQVKHAPAQLWAQLELDANPRLDLLQGAFARRLPLQRWWRQGRSAVALVALAFFAWTALQLLQIRMLDTQFREVDAQVRDVYRSVMPDGVLVNAEQQLAAQLARLEGGGGEGVLVLLSQLAPLLTQQGGLLITRLDYNAPRGELQLSLSAERNGDILAFTDALQAQGLQAQAQGFSRQGQAQLANVTIRELNR